MASVADAVASIDIDQIYNNHIIDNEPPLLTGFKENLAAGCKRMMAGGISKERILPLLNIIYKLLNEECGREVSKNLLTKMNRYNKLFGFINDLDDIFSENEKSPTLIGSAQYTLQALKKEQNGYLLEILKVFEAMATVIEESPISNDDNAEIELPPTEQQPLVVLKDNFLPKPILKGENSPEGTSKRAMKFKVDETSILLRERVNLFKDYEHYFIFNEVVEQVKAMDSKPCLCLYFDGKHNICAIIIHKNGENETIYLRNITNTPDDNRVVKDLTDQMRNIMFELLLQNNRAPYNLKLKDKALRLIAANCLNYSKRVPLSHREFNPLHVFKFAKNNKIKEFVKTYFFKEDIRESFALDDDSHDEGDAYIVFTDNKTSEESLDQIAMAISKGYKLIQIKVLPEHNPQIPLNVNDVIDEIRKVYTLIDEEPITACFKKELADRAKEKMIGDGFGMRKINLSELIRMYVIANMKSRFKQQFLMYVDAYYKGRYSFNNTILSIKNLYVQSYGEYQVQPILVEYEAQLNQFDKNMLLEAVVEKKQKEKSDILNPLTPCEYFLSKLPVERSPSVYTAGQNLMVKISMALNERVLTNIEAATIIKVANTKYECLNSGFKTKQESIFDNENVQQELNENDIQKLIDELCNRGDSAREVAMCFNQFVETTASLQSTLPNTDFSAESVTARFNEDSGNGKILEEERSSQNHSGGIYSFLPSPVVSPQCRSVEHDLELNVEGLTI